MGVKTSRYGQIAERGHGGESRDSNALAKSVIDGRSWKVEVRARRRWYYKAEMTNVRKCRVSAESLCSGSHISSSWQNRNNIPSDLFYLCVCWCNFLFAFLSFCAMTNVA
jgi:hypothetical protein